MNPLSVKLVLVTLMAILPLGIVMASPALPSPTPVPPAVSSADSSRHLNNLKTHGVAEADRRLSLLQTVATRLADSTQLTASDRNTLGKQVEGQITALGALKSKLAAESNLAAARKNIQSLIDGYKIYGLLVAQISIVTASDRLAETGTQLQAVATELQKKADTLKDSGRDTAELQKNIDTAKTAIATAQPLYNMSTAQILAFKPSDYAADHKILSGYRDSIATARDGFRTARSSIGDSITEIDKLK